MNKKGLVGFAKASLILAIFVFVVIFTYNYITLISAEGSPSIWTTDAEGNPQTDFAPYTNVYIHGSDFLPDNNIDVYITRPDSVIDQGLVSSDPYGSLVYEYYIADEIEGLYQVSATDGANTAEVNFTDHVPPPLECKDLGFDFKVAKWEWKGYEGWKPENGISNGTSVTGNAAVANWSAGTSEADGIVVKASHDYRVINGTNGTVYKGDHDMSFIMFCGYKPRCGDGHVDQGEECDDGNNVNGDGCSADCKKEMCNDNEELIEFTYESKPKSAYVDNSPANVSYKLCNNTDIAVDTSDGNTHYIYMNWNEDELNISDYDDAAYFDLMLQHKEDSSLIKVQLKNQTGQWIDVCNPPERSSYTWDTCDLKPYLNIMSQVSVIELRVVTWKSGTCHEYLKCANLKVKLYSCEPTEYCGNDIVTPPEQCELPNTPENLLCSQTTTGDCDGFKFGQRDAYGNCDAACGCIDDPFEYSCVPGQCEAICDEDSDCESYCGADDVYYYGGICDLQTTCSCSYTLEDCDVSDGCYVYGTGCEDRDYYCTLSGCDYTYSRNEDSYDAFVFYCKTGGVWKHRQFVDYSCNGACEGIVSWVDDELVEDCDANDGWYDTGQTRWIETDQCNEKEQKEQEYRDYSCSQTPEVYCDYIVTGYQWVDTGKTGYEPLSTPCEADQNLCTIDHCNGTGTCVTYDDVDCSSLDDQCQEGVCSPCDGLCYPDYTDYPLSTPCEADGHDCTVDHCNGQGSCEYWKDYDCSGYDLPPIGDCDNIPDDYHYTWDSALGFESECFEGASGPECTTGSYTFTHTCADNDLFDSVPLGGCDAECDENADCQNYCDGSTYYYAGACENDCTCSYTPENCDALDRYDAWEYYCEGNGLRQHRLFHDYTCGPNGCYEYDSYYVDDGFIEDCYYYTQTCEGTEVWYEQGYCNPNINQCDARSGFVEECDYYKQTCEGTEVWYEQGICSDGICGSTDGFLEECWHEDYSCSGDDVIYEYGFCGGGSCQDDAYLYDSCDDDYELCKGDEIWSHDEFCIDGSCDYSETPQEDCDLYNYWFGGGDFDAYGDDPACVYTDYYCDVNGEDAFCAYADTYNEDFDYLDTSPYCFDPRIGNMDAWCDLVTCDWITPDNGCDPGYTPHVNGCSEDCNAECDEDADCSSYCLDNIFYGQGTCDLQGACTCSYTPDNCGDMDYYDEYVRYCEGDTVREHRLYHYYTCDAHIGCKENTEWRDDHEVDNCDAYDKDYCFGDLLKHDEGYCEDAVCKVDTTTTKDCYYYNEFCDFDIRMSETGYCDGSVPQCDYRTDKIFDCSDNNYDDCLNTYYTHHYTETCYEDQGATQCLPASSIADCRDAYWCNGEEVCSEEGGVHCISGTPVDCADGVECTVDSCDEDSDQCVRTPDDSYCDDDLWCNGNEYCDAINDCQPGNTVDCSYLNSQCGDGFCNENANACELDPYKLSTPCQADASLCTIDHCDGTGTCITYDNVYVPPAEACKAFYCDPVDGQIKENYTAYPYSTPCEADQDACTKDHCNGLGACVFLEDLHKNLSAPVKTVGDPKIVCDESDWCDYKITMLTPITLECEEGTQVKWRYQLNGVWKEWQTSDSPAVIYFPEECNHTLEAYCFDECNEGPHDIEYFKVEGTKFEIVLNQKWNLISVPVFLLEDDPETVFNDIKDKVKGVWTYDPTNEMCGDEWCFWIPGLAADNIPAIEPGWGYWVLMDDNAVLTIGGSLMRPAMDMAHKAIVPGWNLIGYYGVDDGLTIYDGPNLYGEGKPAYCALYSLGGDIWSKQFTGLWTYWEPDNPYQWKELGSNNYMNPGAGYWLTVPHEGVYTPSESCEMGDSIGGAV
jgi:hypothetical protein